MRNKVVGIIDIFFGSLFALVQLGLLLFVYPQMFALYGEFNAPLPQNTNLSPVYSVIFLLLFLSVVVVGVKLLKKPTDKLFKIGFIQMIAMIVFAGYFIALSVLGVIIPIYSLTSSLK